MEWYELVGLLIAFYVMHRENQKMYRDLSETFTKEMKDFHGRLCSLEEKHNKNIEEIVKNAMEKK